MLNFDFEKILEPLLRLSSQVGAKFSFGLSALGVLVYLTTLDVWPQLVGSVATLIVYLVFVIARRQQEKEAVSKGE
jgi:hypothetical protein